MYPIFFWWSNRAIDSIQLLLSYAVGLWFWGTNIRFSKLNRETSKNVCSQTLSLEALSTMTHFVTKSNTLLLWHCTKVRPHGRSKSSWLWLEFLVPIRRSSSWEMRLHHIVAINLCSSPNLYGTIWNNHGFWLWPIPNCICAGRCCDSIRGAASSDPKSLLEFPSLQLGPKMCMLFGLCRIYLRMELLSFIMGRCCVCRGIII